MYFHVPRIFTAILIIALCATILVFFTRTLTKIKKMETEWPDINSAANFYKQLIQATFSSKPSSVSTLYDALETCTYAGTAVVIFAESGEVLSDGLKVHRDKFPRAKHAWGTIKGEMYSIFKACFSNPLHQHDRDSHMVSVPCMDGTYRQKEILTLRLSSPGVVIVCFRH